MWKIGFLIFFAIGCTDLVRPNYLDPQTDLSNRIEKGYKDLEENPSKEGVSRLLEDSYTYHKRVGEEIKYNNKKALKG